MISMTGNDVIGIDIPTVGGDTDAWGDNLNDSSLKQLSKAAFAARSDRNLTILGGGKISWNQAGNALTFTEDIIIRDHITDKTVTITTAASPISLTTAQQVAYVEINRGPTSNQSINAATVVSAGALPNTKDKNGVVVLFHRTTDGTIMIPWCRRELLDGDHWQFGAALSWFERIATFGKPSYQANPSDTSQVIIPGSATVPSVVMINGKLYANTSDKTVDLDTAGRNGLDTGAKAANTMYYLYAIPAASGRGFDGILSTTAPTGAGPSGFTATKSYLGGCPTIASSAIPNFTSVKGEYLLDTSATAFEVTANSSTITAKTLLVPTPAKSVYCRSRWTAVSAAGVDTEAGATSSATTSRHRATTTTAASNALAFWKVILQTAQTIYVKVSNTTVDAIAISVFGWTENPMEYQ